MVTDEHFPFQNEKARSVAMSIVRAFDPDIRICGSDGLDFYALSKFDKNPERASSSKLQLEINAWKTGQREWRDASPNAKPFFLTGNHEDRLRKYLWKHPELADLEVLRLENILDFAGLGIEEGGSELMLYDNLVIRHGDHVRKYSGYSAKAELEREFFSRSILTGHTHRGGSHFATARGKVIEAHECFCLCSLEPEYVEHPNWQNGIVLAEVDKNHLWVDPILFHNYKGKVIAHWRGKEYKA